MLWHRHVALLSVSADYDEIDRDAYDGDYAAGFEVSFVDFVHVRYGQLAEDYKMYGFGVGWDYGHVLFRVDFAHTRPENAFLRQELDLERDTLGAVVGVRW
jgi:hypothetical protein